jgi:hypothetical protein
MNFSDPTGAVIQLKEHVVLVMPPTYGSDWN